MKVDYYHIACNDLRFTEHVLDTIFYRHIACNAQQVVEKLLKSILELVSADSSKLLSSNDIKAIYLAIKEIDESICLDIDSLSLIRDIYLYSRYPCDNYITVDFELCRKSISLMYDCVEEVNKWRKDKGLDTIEFCRKDLIVESPFTHLNTLANMPKEKKGE